jgi:flagellar basal body-associated protein FliL
MSEKQANEGKSGSSKLVLVLVALNVITMAGFGAFVFLGGGSKSDAEAAPSAAEAGHGAKPEEAKAEHGKEAKAEHGKEDKAEHGKEAEAPKEGGHGGEAPAEGAAAEVPDGESRITSLGAFVINLNDPGASRYLKAVIKADVSSAAVAIEIASREAQLRDTVIGFLSGLTLRETQGPRAKALIRESLTRRLNNLLTEGEVRQVYFTEFVTQ